MQHIGERLEEARKRKGISIREAAEATKVRSDYLHRFESSQFDINLPDIYVRGFLRAYAGYLGLPADKIVADYNALGHGKPKGKSLNREIYGRMDISVPDDSSGDSRDGENAKGGAGEAEHESRAASYGSRPPGGGLPVLDRALLIKGGIVASIALVAAILIFAIVRMSGSGDDDVVTPTEPDDSVAGHTVAGENVIIIHALDTVRVKVVDVATNEELFQGSIVRGDNRSFPWNGRLYVTANALENIEFEMDGKRHRSPITGHNRVEVPSPAAHRGQ